MQGEAAWGGGHRAGLQGRPSNALRSAYTSVSARFKASVLLFLRDRARQTHPCAFTDSHTGAGKTMRKECVEKEQAAQVQVYWQN